MFGITDFNQAIVNFENFDLSQLGNAAVFGGAILLIGMLTIFIVLIIIWFALALFKFAFHDLAAKRSVSRSAESAGEAEAPLPVIQAAEDSEIIAVIAAAIAMAESESSGRKFKVVSFRRK